MPSSFRRSEGLRKTISRNRERSMEFPGTADAVDSRLVSRMSLPKASSTELLAAESVSRSSLATASASKTVAASQLDSLRVKLDFPVAIPPVIPSTGTSPGIGGLLGAGKRSRSKLRKGSGSAAGWNQRFNRLFLLLLLNQRITGRIDQASGNEDHEVALEVLIHRRTE